MFAGFDVARGLAHAIFVRAESSRCARADEAVRPRGQSAPLLGQRLASQTERRFLPLRGRLVPSTAATQRQCLHVDVGAARVRSFEQRPIVSETEWKQCRRMFITTRMHDSRI